MLNLQCGVDSKCRFDIVEYPAPTIFQYKCRAAQISDHIEIMSHNDHGTILALDEKLFETAYLKALVADGQYLIDEVAIEVDGKRHAESQPGPHARRNRF